MPLSQLKIQPGMARFGTVYESKGRWYGGNLVRWFDRVLQAWGGWEPITTITGDRVVDAVLSYDQSADTYTDETADAASVGGGDVFIYQFPTTSGDTLYVGHPGRFERVKFNISTNRAGLTIVWEYWNGSAWTSFSVTDGTDSFANVGANDVTFLRPSDWARTSVNSVGPYYWVRARTTTAGIDNVVANQILIGDGDLSVGAPVRGMHAWKRNTGASLLAMGTATKLWLFGTSTLTDITPAGFTTGSDDASQNSAAFGTGAFGAGPFGVGDSAEDTLTEANSWQLDNWGEDLIACALSDGKLYQYDVSAGSIAAITNAPTGCSGVFVTNENFVVALGASSVPRDIKWADVDDITNWTSAADNFAGSLSLKTAGHILAGRTTSRENLIWTDVDLQRLLYVGGEFVYGANTVGTCNLISRQAIGVFDDKVVWMGTKGFYLYDGEVRPLPSDVSDYVFTDINRTQASKIHCYRRADYGEVIWHYPSGTSTECDRYVAYNYWDNFFYIGALDRTAGVDAGVYSFPIAVDSNGVVYRHEIEGGSTLDPNGDAIAPYLESGPVEIGSGDAVMDLLGLVPDEKTQGDVTVSIYTSLLPNASETLNGPYTLSNLTSVRLNGRWIRLRLDQVRTGWRFGVPRLDVQAGGRR